MAKMSPEGRHESRYARVKAILEAAAGNSASNDGGRGRFWDLPLDALVEAKASGVRLIAPAAQASCCGHGESRSTGSGLIHALRGAPPFNGTAFRHSCGTEAAWRRKISPSSPNGSTMAARLTKAAILRSTSPSANRCGAR